MTKYPEHIILKEVAPRDGWQKYKRIIPTEQKIRLIKSMIDYGVKELEIGVFAKNPKLARQYPDIEEVCKAIIPYAEEHGVKLNVLASDEPSVSRVLKAGIHVFDYFISVSDTFGKGFGASADEIFKELEQLVKVPGAEVRLALGAVFGCPFGETVSVEKTISYIKRAVDMGISEIGLGDSAGKGDPLHTEMILSEIAKEFAPDQFSLHIHNTEGFGLANCVKAMELGFFRFDVALGGMGGCPVIPNAKGNIPTEDFANLLYKMGIRTEINLQKCIQASLDMSELIKNPVISSAAENMLLRRNADMKKEEILKMADKA